MTKNPIPRPLTIASYLVVIACVVAFWGALICALLALCEVDTWLSPLGWLAVTGVAWVVAIAWMFVLFAAFKRGGRA